MRNFLLLALLAVINFSLIAQTKPGAISGVITDKATGAPIIGVSVVLAGTFVGTATDAQGKFSFKNLAAKEYRLDLSFISYKKISGAPVTVKPGEDSFVNIEMVEQTSELENIVVMTFRPIGSAAGTISQAREMKVVASGISSQQITMNQDKDASEVVKRIPGISIVDDKFIVVRGLAQRYNNTWVNSAAVPSSEADSRAFSFDILPSSQIENIMIVKTPAPDYPSDFSGGLVLVQTKKQSEKNSMEFSYGTGMNSRTHFKEFLYNPGSKTDFLGFDNGMRKLADFVPSRLDNTNLGMVNKVTKEGFASSWDIKKRNPILDQKVNFAINRFWTLRSGAGIGVNAAINYSYSNKTISNMTNAQFGIYDPWSDKSVKLFSYTDDIYTTDVKLGAIANISYSPAQRGKTVSKYDFRNIFNQLGKNKLSVREGWRDKSGYYEQQQNEYLYQSRTAYIGQFAATHAFNDKRENKLDWNASYSYSNRLQPDRRIVERQKDPSNGIDDYAIDQSSVQRFFTDLQENVVSVAANHSMKLNPSASKPIEFRDGVLVDFKLRNYSTREFAYKWNMQNTLPSGFQSLPTWEIFDQSNLGAPDKIHIQDETSNTNNYDAQSYTIAAYGAFYIPIGRFNFDIGARYERYHSTIAEYTQVSTDKRRYHEYPYSNILPAFNATYDINKKSLVRLAYGMSVNRPEFRELSPSAYYDFDMFSTITGNPDLKQATIQNVDLRYEFYPSSGEVISVALFYKHFQNPIEWYYVDAGGTFQFSFMNARNAINYGIELDLRKKLDIIGLPNLTLTANVAMIKSKVNIVRGGVEFDRPMQGQSPYIVNTGLFYQPRNGKYSVGVLYNRIGRRIIGVGHVQGSNGDSFNNNLPDMYEEPRDNIDLTASVKITKSVALKLSIKDILAQDVVYSQNPEFMTTDGLLQTRRQIPRRYNPGTGFSMSLSATF